VNFEYPNSELFPFFKNSKAITADLGPNDILYLPPYWFHRVTTLTFSISVNIWSYTIYSEIHRILFDEGLPEMIKPITQETKSNLKFLLQYIFSLILKIKNFDQISKAKEYLNENLFKNRYYAIQNDFPECSEKEFSATKCPFNNIENIEVIDDNIKFFSEKISRIIMFIKNESIKDIILIDYIEKISNIMIGVENLCVFFKCINYNN
jgi:hypothetical protein